MHRNQGNALFLILIAVALFAALSYAITQSGRGDGSVDKERSQIMASEILQYAAQIEQAIMRMQMINGCTDTQISFLYDWNGDGATRNDQSADHANTTSHPDIGCGVFADNGGQVPWMPRPSTLESSDMHRDYRLNGDTIFIGHGDDNLSELTFTFSLSETESNRALCQAINRIVDLPINASNDANYNHFNYFSWNGTYSDGSTDSTRIIGDNAAEADFVGQKTGCFFASRNGTRFVFYHIVIPR